MTVQLKKARTGTPSAAYLAISNRTIAVVTLPPYLSLLGGSSPPSKVVIHRRVLISPLAPSLTSVTLSRPAALLAQALNRAGNAEHHHQMELSLETYRLVVQHVESKADLCTLCRVNKRFQREAEQALYNTIYASDARDTLWMCSLLARTPRLAVFVEELTLFVGAGDDGDGRPQLEVCLPNDFWPTVSKALHQTTRLRFLNIYLDNAGNSTQAWILNGTTFQLRRFHCDLRWDTHLVSFLNTQTDIDDLYISDYSTSEGATQTSTFVSSSIDPGALPNLSILECTFAEAAFALVPTRPISRLKTCFSKTRLPEKREELSSLFSKLMKTTQPLRSLDIADSSYSESFSMELLTSVVRLQNQVHDLHYLGILVLPINGRVRLKFYGLLRRLSSLKCVEVDVSEWEPPPPVPAGVRALASELRLYCPALQKVVFVNEFERTVVAVSHGTYAVNCDSNTEYIWREF